MNDNNKNLALARFITSFGSMNNYKSSVLQTKRVLDNEVGAKLPKNDTAILYDALDGISAIEDKGFNSDGIIEVNKAFTYSENEDPQLPGLGCKLVFFPVLFLGIALLLGFRDAPLAVLLTVFGAPIAVSSFTMAQQMGGDHALAGQLVVFSSIFSVVTMFLFIFLLKEMAFL